MLPVKRLAEKWGDFSSEGHFISNCPLSFISSSAKLNVLFAPELPETVNSVFSKQLHAQIHPELEAFYRSYNGCRLFFGSLNIYGLQMHRDEVYEPFDLVLENRNLIGQFKKTDLEKLNLLFFASLGGDYVFGYDKYSPGTVSCLRVGTAKVLRTYSSIESFFTYFFDALYEEYDADGRRLHPDNRFVKIPVLANKVNELI